MKKQKTIPIFVPHMGCPNDCSFCNQKTITGQSSVMTPALAKQTIENALTTIAEDSFVEIGFFGGSFTGIEKDLQKQFLEVAQGFLRKGNVHAVRLSTRPDYIDEETALMLKCYGVKTVELGAQSMDDRVLAMNHRGHTCQDTERAAKTITDAGLQLGLQMMTGLYGDTESTCIESARKMIALSPDCVRIYPTLVLRGTMLSRLYKEGAYQPRTLEQAVSLCADIKTLFDEANIPVIRLGLQATDNINPDKDVVAGPYHASFGELVQSELYFRKLKACVHADCDIAVHPSSLSAFLGNRKCNIEKFNQLGIRVRFIQDTAVMPGTFQLIRKKGGKLCV